MLRRTILTAVTCCLCLAAGPTTRPTAKPPAATTTPTRVRDGLVNGALRYLVPPDWEIMTRSIDRMSVYYRDKGERATYSILCTQQAQAIPQHDPRVKQQLVELALNWSNADLAKRKVEVLEPPKVVPDDRFFLKTHERFKDGEATWDVVHTYRAMGLNLVGLTSATSNEEKGQIAAVHENAALIMSSMTLAQQDPKIVRPVNVAPEEKK